MSVLDFASTKIGGGTSSEVILEKEKQLLGIYIFLLWLTISDSLAHEFISN